MPPKRDEAALQEEEELQLAIALSQSEAEEKERMVGFHYWTILSLEVQTLDSAKSMLSSQMKYHCREKHHIACNL